MHVMPGLPILHSRDLVNWALLGYAFNRLDLGPEFSLENGKQMYGQGIWAPSFRYRNGTFYIFTNINGHSTQRFSAKSPRGPWTRVEMKKSLHDLSVLFDDDGKAYVIWGYRDIHFAHLNDDLTDIVPSTERVLFDRDAGMGEGSHFYKIRGKYYITSAWYAGRMRMPAARADHPQGPYEVNKEISADEDFGLVKGYRLKQNKEPPFDLNPPDSLARGQISLHQGGIVETPSGEWWGFSMMDYNSVGRLTALSPVTLQDGWPYFGLRGNLGRTPRMWVKPSGTSSPPTAPYTRGDRFDGPAFSNVWQWNHVPVDSMWSLNERRGYLRLHALPATGLLDARNTLTQRAIGPRSSPTTILETAGMRVGDVAGLALLNAPIAWIGVRRDAAGTVIEEIDTRNEIVYSRRLESNRVWLRADCDFLTEKARLTFSTDGAHFEMLGDEFAMVFQLKTFQGVRYSLFNYTTASVPGGYADFDEMLVNEPAPRGLARAIPLGATIHIAGDHFSGDFTIQSREKGRVTLRSNDCYLSTATSGATHLSKSAKSADVFQWIETIYGKTMFLSLTTSRYLRVDPKLELVADGRGPEPGGHDGAQFTWTVRH